MLYVHSSCERHPALDSNVRRLPQVHEAGPGPDAWTQVAAWETDLAVTGLAWAHPEYGRVLAGATTSGSVLVWGQVREAGGVACCGLDAA
jgi:hypothetical protein